MKKIMFIALATMFVCGAYSCTGNSEKAANNADTCTVNVVSVDSITPDSIAPDSVK